MPRLNSTFAEAEPLGGKPGARAGRIGSGVQSEDAAVSLDEPLLDCQAAAALLNVRVSWVRDAARLGHLPCVRVGRAITQLGDTVERVLKETGMSEEELGAREQLGVLEKSDQ